MSAKTQQRSDRKGAPRAAGPRRNIYRRPEGGDARAHTPMEADVACAIASECLGCPLINRPYGAQIDLKRVDFAERLGAAGLNPEPRVSHFEEAASRLGYRHSVKLAISADPVQADRSRPLGGKGQGRGAPSGRWIRIGLFRPGTRDVTDVGWCAAQAGPINGVLQSLRHAIKTHEVPVHGERGPQAMPRSDGRWQRDAKPALGLRYVIIRKAYVSDAMHLTFVSSLDMPAKFMLMARHLRQRHADLLGVTAHINTTAGNAFIDSSEGGTLGTSLVLGEETLPDVIADIKVSWAPLAFVQANPAVTERMVRRIWEIADCRPLETWLDVYCGVGLIGLGAAKRATHVIGIEENPIAVQQAVQNAQLNGVTNWQGFAGRAEDILGGAPAPDQDVLAGRVLGVVTLNPSRRGCQPEVLSALAARRPRQIIYMSCDAGTLVRDLKILDGLNFETRLIENFDMFPGTSHYETLAVLTPR